MAAKTNLITTTEITVNPREIDFVTRFQRNWEHLREIMGIMRPIRMQPGTVLKSKYAQGTLQSGTVAEGEETPNSQYTVKEKDYGKITIEKYAKAVSLEAIQNYGYDVAVQKTDDEFLFDLTAKVTDKFYKYLNTGSLKGTPKTFQMALAMAKGSVENKFKNMHRTVTEAMQLAAYYSQARAGQNVPVDYTLVKYVKKPAGARPGMVIYTTYQTAVVTPDAALCEALKEKN